ncbi:MAG TPA: prepilin-type N-terminal cleavage/methylation domain-containing protein [Verrucomicrobiae bacterium]|nr:prepilin-type N-terminal cleavage/methylation domain-containing protein [Verrucomicrobiae bacterium]
MFINPAAANKRGMTLVELMVATGIFSISGIALATIFLFCIRSFAAMTNYATLDKCNRHAMDIVTAEIRQAQKVLSFSSNSTSTSLTILNGAGANVTYAFDSTRQQFTRNDGNTTVLLTNCNLVAFGLYVRPPASNSFDMYPLNTGVNWQQQVKTIQLTWKTSMNICPTAQINSEDVQTACIVIRKQQ